MSPKQREIAQILHFYDQKWGLKRIAQEVGWSVTGIKKLLIRRGVYCGAAQRLFLPESWQTQHGATVAPRPGGLTIYLPSQEAEAKALLPE